MDAKTFFLAAFVLLIIISPIAIIYGYQKTGRINYAAVFAIIIGIVMTARQAF
jgi:uncharacterized membrane protein